ncbi:MAG: hypothetical protein M0Q13_09805 [Methanothrix sp.]|jgi:hypothetical protein|nr:hypothetical protein [Methanothrix sp.]
MKIPKKIKFEGHIFDVNWVDGKELDEDDDELVYADVNRSELLIRLRNGVKRSVIEESFFHEIIHLCDSETHPMSHKLVDDIARRLYALLKENGMLKENGRKEIIKDE